MIGMAASRPTPDDWKQLSALLETFASDKDRTIAAARQIEGQIATRFPADHAIRDLAESFGQYRPGGAISSFPKRHAARGHSLACGRQGNIALNALRPSAADGHLQSFANGRFAAVQM